MTIIEKVFGTIFISSIFTAIIMAANFEIAVAMIIIAAISGLVTYAAQDVCERKEQLEANYLAKHPDNNN